MTGAKRDRREMGEVYDLFDGTRTEIDPLELDKEDSDEVPGLIVTPGGSQFSYRLDGSFELQLNQALSREPQGTPLRDQLESLDTMRVVAEEAGAKISDRIWMKLLAVACSDTPPVSESWEALMSIGPMWREQLNAGFNPDPDFIEDCVRSLLGEI